MGTKKREHFNDAIDPELGVLSAELIRAILADLETVIAGATGKVDSHSRRVAHRIEGDPQTPPVEANRLDVRHPLKL